MGGNFHKVEPLLAEGVQARVGVDRNCIEIDSHYDEDDAFQDSEYVQLTHDEALQLRTWLVRATRPDDVNGATLTEHGRKALDYLDDLRIRVNQGETHFAALHKKPADEVQKGIEHYTLTLAFKTKTAPATAADLAGATDLAGLTSLVAELARDLKMQRDGFFSLAHRIGELLARSPDVRQQFQYAGWKSAHARIPKPKKKAAKRATRKAPK